MVKGQGHTVNMLNCDKPTQIIMPNWLQLIYNEDVIDMYIDKLW